MLVIVDLQEDYRDEFNRQRLTFKRTLQHLRQRILVAVENKEIILRLNNEQDGSLIKEIKELAPGYSLSYNLYKSTWDGSNQIFRFIKRNQLATSKIELAGAFVNVCVLKTWQGLKNRGLKVLPINKNLVLHAPGAKECIEEYPEGYLE